MFVKPATGRTVRDPVKCTLLPEIGTEVPESIFWIKRLRDGDVVKVDTSAPVEKLAAVVKNVDAVADKSAASTDAGSTS